VKRKRISLEKMAKRGRRFFKELRLGTLKEQLGG